MSFQAVADVLEHSESTGSDRLVLITIAECANHDGSGAYPSVQTIAHRARVSRATVHRSLKTLEGLGELVVEYKKGPRGCNLYTVLLSAPSQIETVSSVRRDRLTGDTRTIIEPSLPSSKEEGETTATTSQKKKKASPPKSSPPPSPNWVGVYCDNLAAKALTKNKQILGKEAKALAKEVEPDVLERAIKALAQKDVHPSKLSTFVHYERKNGNGQVHSFPDRTDESDPEWMEGVV